MGSDVRHVRGEAQKELVKKFEVFSSNGRSRWQVWSDWITMSAIAVSNATDRSHFDEREKQYLSIAGKYTRPEMEAFTEMLALLVVALEDNPEQDFLGELYMCLGLGNDHAGQFFTPYHLCEFMSAVTTPAEEFQQKIGDRGWVAVCDPTCGAGALLVAFANECRKKGINYQTDVLFVAQDIDYIVGMMCYLQMSLLGMPGYVVIGDTLASPSVSYDKRGLLPVNKGNVWYTPMLRIPVWQYRIFILQESKFLDHCIQRGTRYFERISVRESYIFFLRKKSDPNTPWYTLEVEPGGTVRQKRSYSNDQYADLEDAKPFIEEWQQVVQGRMTASEISFAKQSKEIRAQEFAELKENGNIIRTGANAGKLLVDELMHDLMEVEKRVG